jgi:hypothetical protein
MVIPARSEELVHIRIELPSAPRALLREFSNEQDAALLQAALRALRTTIRRCRRCLWEDPPRGCCGSLRGIAVQPWSPDQWLPTSMASDRQQGKHARIKFPRRW